MPFNLYQKSTYQKDTESKGRGARRMPEHLNGAILHIYVTGGEGFWLGGSHGDLQHHPSAYIKLPLSLTVARSLTPHTTYCPLSPERGGRGVSHQFNTGAGNVKGAVEVICGRGRVRQGPSTSDSVAKTCRFAICNTLW